MRQREVVVVKIPIFRGEITDVGPHDHKPAAGLQNAPNLRKDSITFFLGPQVLEKIGSEYDIKCPILDPLIRSARGPKEFDILVEILTSIGVEVDGIFLLSPNVVDKLAITASQVRDDLILSYQPLEKMIAQRLPDDQLLRSVSLSRKRNRYNFARSGIS